MTAGSDAAEVELTIDRPVAGGRMLARHDGQVTLVAGAIPGERVRARIERRASHVLWAQTVEVLDASPDRREPMCALGCGGSLYAHITYDRQRQIKAEVIADAFRRIGKLALDRPPDVRPSPERGYRMRARFHVRGRRAGFFLEGSHVLCDAEPTGQLHTGALEAIHALVDAMGSRADDCDGIVVAENVDATQRVLHLEPRSGARLDTISLPSPLPHTSGITTHRRGRIATLAGIPTVTDSAAQLLNGRSSLPAPVLWTRHAASFFQANRFLVGDLLTSVLTAAAGETCVDLYAGVGLFAAAMAAGSRRVVAVEGDPMAAADLAANARPFHDSLRVIQAPVEAFLSRPELESPDVVVLDPPRAGVAASALAGLIAWSPARIIYVSCDPPTLARDGSRLVASGYALESIEAFDLFPNTPHVETVTVFAR